MLVKFYVDILLLFRATPLERTKKETKTRASKKKYFLTLARDVAGRRFGTFQSGLRTKGICFIPCFSAFPYLFTKSEGLLKQAPHVSKYDVEICIREIVYWSLYSFFCCFT